MPSVWTEGIYIIQSVLLDRYRNKHPEMCARPRAKLWGTPGLRPTACLLVHSSFSSPPPHPSAPEALPTEPQLCRLPQTLRRRKRFFTFFFTHILHVGKPQTESKYHEMLSFSSQTNIHICACMMGNFLFSSELKHLLDYSNDRT